MSYGPVIPFDPRSGEQMMRRAKSSQGFIVSPSSTWPRSHDMQFTAAASRPPLQQLANNSWSNPYKSHHSQPRNPYPQQPPSAYRYPVYPHTKDMYHNFQLNPPPPLATFRDPDALSATWIGPDGQQKDWNTLEREAGEELMRRKSTRSSTSSRQQPPLTTLAAGYPTGFDPKIRQPAVRAPGGPGGFMNPQQVNVYANHVHAGPSRNQVVGRQVAQETDEFGESSTPSASSHIAPFHLPILSFSFVRLHVIPAVLTLFLYPFFREYSRTVTSATYRQRLRLVAWKGRVNITLGPHRPYQCRLPQR